QFAGWTGPSGRVFAFEPNPEARSVLRRHISINHLEGRIEVVASAIGDFTGEVTFAGCGNDGMSRVGAANPLLLGRGELRELKVPITTIDAFCQQRAI